MNVLRSILLVDDSPQDIELTIIGLKEVAEVKNPIEVFNDGEELLDYLYRRGKFENRPNPDPAFILLDLKMCKVDGFQVLESVKKEDGLRYIPVIIFSSSNEPCDIEKSYVCGANAFVVKPVDSTLFMKTVKSIGLFWGTINIMPEVTNL